jgi:polysaccharide export outer membrane protein
MQKANLNILPNDIIYVEPIRRVFNESVKDAAPVLGVITNVITLFIVIQSLNNSNN